MIKLTYKDNHNITFARILNSLAVLFVLRMRSSAAFICSLRRFDACQLKPFEMWRANSWMWPGNRVFPYCNKILFKEIFGKTGFVAAVTHWLSLGVYRSLIWAQDCSKISFYSIFERILKWNSQNSFYVWYFSVCYGSFHYYIKRRYETVILSHTEFLWDSSMVFVANHR